MKWNLTMQLDSSQRGARRAVFGLSIVGIGTLAMLDNLHLYELNLLHTFWPLVFVVWGLARLAWPRPFESRLFGLVLILIGTLMTLHRLGHHEFELHQWWPVFVILIGLSILFRGSLPWSRDREIEVEVITPTVDHADALNIDATFGNIEQRNDSRHFRGGKIAVTFGGVEIDLRDALMEGPEAVIVIKATFGGVELRVPRHWQVISQLKATMGNVEVKSVPPLQPSHCLVLRGEALFGNVEISN